MLTNIQEVSYSPLTQAQIFKAQLLDQVCSVKSQSDQMINMRTHYVDGKLSLNLDLSSEIDPALLVAIGVEYLLGHISEITSIEIQSSYKLGYPFSILGPVFERFEFFQIPLLWHHTAQYTISPEKWTKTDDGRTHPIRPPAHKGYVYKRFVPGIEKTISFRLTEPHKDLDQFHQWHNQSRVSFYWELNQSQEELKTNMEKGLKDPHQIPMIVEIDEELVGYYEMYWVREDRLGPYYNSDAFDRGFHFLIGNKKFLGHQITDSIVKCGLHLLYLDDCRTRRIMAEPRHDNQKVLKYAEASIGWKNLKTFDFPHKRAVLLENSREVFFGGNSL